MQECTQELVHSIHLSTILIACKLAFQCDSLIHHFLTCCRRCFISAAPTFLLYADLCHCYCIVESPNVMLFVYTIHFICICPNLKPNKADSSRYINVENFLWWWWGFSE